MYSVGLDVHKDSVEAAVLDEAGKLRRRVRFPCTREELVRFAKRHLGPHARVALEATSNTWSVVEVLRPLAAEVVVSNPLRTRAIADAKIKTDKIDALVLAQLLRADYLPLVWQPDQATQARRRLTNRRASLVSDRTRIKNRIHAVLHQRLIHPPVDELFGKKGRAWLEALELDGAGRVALDSELRLLGQVESELAHLDEALAIEGYDEPRVRLLMTLPGVDVAVAQTLLAALGDIHRFRSPDHAASYLGLVPSTYQTGDPDHVYHGRITKQGKGQARWMLVQAAQHVGNHPGPIGNFFRRLATRKNRNVAVVATARKLVTIAYHMLKNNEPYRYAVPLSTDAKLARMRVKATGERRRGGLPKGQPRPKTYGSGVRTCTVSALDTIYEREGLPPIAPLSDGELRMLRQQKVLKHVAQTSRPQRQPRRAAPPQPPDSASPRASAKQTPAAPRRAKSTQAPSRARRST
ncbi:IS110 family transposase [Sorangium sp. So ce216]